MLASPAEAQRIDLWEEESTKYELEHVEAKQSLLHGTHTYSTARTCTRAPGHTSDRTRMHATASACALARARRHTKPPCNGYQPASARSAVHLRVHPLLRSHTHERSHAQIRAHAHAESRAHAREHTHTRTHFPLIYHMRAYTQDTQQHERDHEPALTHSQAHACTDTRGRARVSRMCTQPRARGRAHSLTHTTAAQEGARRWSDGC